jgi:hypothetical protein
VLTTDIEKAYGVQGVKLDENDQGYIDDQRGRKWFVYRDEKTSKPFFVNQDPAAVNEEGHKLAQWEDPRSISELVRGMDIS